MNTPVVVIPSRNIVNLRACINAVRLHEPDLQIIVVDDGVDWTAIEIPGAWAPLQIISGIKPFVFAEAVNIGIRAAGDSDVVLLNDDALLESPDGFTLMQSVCRVNQDIGVLGATTNVTGQPLQYRSVRGGPQHWGLRYVPHIAFVCVLLPRSTINLLAKMGETDPRFTNGLDERYVTYGCDDACYCEQVTRAGLKVAVHDGCFVDHSKLTSTFRGKPHAAGNFAASYKLLMEKWGKLESQPK